MIRVAHIITDTDTGGAELMLAKLVRNMDRERFRSDVLSLLPVDNVGESLRADGFTVESAHMRPGLPNPAAFARIVRWLRDRRPTVVQTWMYHSDLIGGLAARYGAGAPVLWNIRQSNLDPAVNTSSTMIAARLCRKLSRRVPEVIVCGSEAARRTHMDFGYHPDHMEVLPNGFDTGVFRPGPEAAARLRSELNIPNDALIVGLAARLDPQKDQATFIRAARILFEKWGGGKAGPGRTAGTGGAEKTGTGGRAGSSRIDAGSRPPVYFVMCGENIEWNNDRLRAWIGEGPDGPFGSRLRLTGRWHDLHAVYPAFDVSGTSSLGEGFPNVVGEAMACGVPCVVTDVGDSRQIVGDTGRVVPPGDPAALAAAWEEVLSMAADERRELGARARQRIEDNYSMKAIARRYEELYTRVYENFYGAEA